MEVVKLSPAALRDLDEIADYIAKDNYARAISFTDELYDACAELSTNPMAHPDRSDLGSGLRLKIYKNYLIIFRIGPDPRGTHRPWRARSEEPFLKITASRNIIGSCEIRALLTRAKQERFLLLRFI